MSSLCEQKSKKQIVAEKCLICGNERDDVFGVERVWLRTGDGH